MGPLKTFCGLAVAVLILSGCGNGSASSAPSSSATGSPPTATGSSGSAALDPTGSPTTSSGGSSGSTSTPPASGSGSAPPPPPPPPPPATGSAKLTWTAPTTNSDGSALTGLAGYHVYYGSSPGSLSNMVNITSPSTVSYLVTGLSAGMWYFAVAAYTNTGLESPMSNVGSKTIS